MITIEQVMSWGPCYDRQRVVELFAGRDTLTIADVLSLLISAKDRLWVLLREECVQAPTLHEFACRVAEQALQSTGSAAPSSVAAIAAKRAWLRGEISGQALATARAAARDAAKDAAWAAASAAAWEAASVASWAAAWAADKDAQLLILQDLLAADAAKGE